MKQMHNYNKQMNETWQILHSFAVQRTVVLKQLPFGVNDIQLYQDFISTLIESSWFVKIWQSLYKGLSLRHICSPEIGNNERIKQGGTTPLSIHMLVVKWLSNIYFQNSHFGAFFGPLVTSWFFCYWLFSLKKYLMKIL